MARTLCYYCEKRPSDNLLDTPICQPCYDYQGAENEHSDEGHEAQEAATGLANPNCLICMGAPNPETTEPVKGHSNGIAKSHTSHAACKHPRTKKDRAQCRKERAQKGE